MFKSVLFKTLYEKRWGILGWSLAMFATTLLIVLIFPVFKDSFGEQLKNVPESLKPVLGEAADYQHLSGFLELQVFAQMMFLTFIYGIILCTSLLAGEENKGTLQSLLAQPISRTRVYWQKFLAAVKILSFVSIALFLGIVAGAAILGEPISYLRVFQATFMQLLLSIALSSIAFGVGAMTGKRAVAGTVAGVYTFAAYMVTTLAGTAAVLKTANYGSLFKYFMNTRILENGIALKNMVPMVLLSLAFLILGWVVFIRRNIYQQ